MAKDYIIDFETLDTTPTAKVATLAVVVFDSDCEKDTTVDELMENGLFIKFDIKSQTERTASKETISWIKSQDKEVQKAYIPSENDLTLQEGLDKVYEFLLSKGVKFKHTLAYCRGTNYDFPIYDDIVGSIYSLKTPYRYYNLRDVRTAIESMLLTRKMTKPPMPPGIFDKLTAHNCLHDCIMDVLHLKYAEQYARGLKTVDEDYV